MTAVEAKKLVLEREDDLIGHKRMIYIIDEADKTKEPTRKVTTDFFKNTLGFTDNDIIFIDNSEFRYGNPQFSAATQEALKEFARPIFEDTSHSLAKQVLNIAVIEKGDSRYSSIYSNVEGYFSKYSNFELTIELTGYFTLANAR